MNNRYLFKGKTIDNKEWVIGYYEESNGNSYINYEETIEKYGKSLKVTRSKEVIPETVGQCTGLKDKNRKLVFEGDVCEIHGSVGVIRYDKCDAMYTFIYAMDTFIYDKNITTNFSCIWGEDLEIIGNIHDNPELLEVKK